MDLRETEKFKRGHSAELMVSELLQRRGWYVIPSYDYAGDDHNKAPKLQGERAAYVIPDLDAAKNGQSRFVEVKAKAQATYHRKSERFEHGIPLRHFTHYLKVQEITGRSVWLVVYEEDTGDVLQGKLDDLAQFKRIYEGDKMSRGGMVFFPRDKFILLGKMGVALLQPLPSTPSAAAAP